MARETATSVHRFESAGTTLHAVIAGEGRPLVVLHGGLADHHASLHLALPLTAAGFRLVLPDLRGSGRSVYSGALSWDLLADDLDALLRSLGLERASIAGISSGSGVAVRFALRHPERVAKLGIVSPVYAGAEIGLSAEQRATFQHMNAFGQQTLVDGIQALHPLFETLPAEIRTQARAIADTFDPASVAATTAFLAAGEQPFESLAELSGIRAEAILVPGDDALHPAAVSSAYAETLPNCRIGSLSEL